MPLDQRRINGPEITLQYNLFFDEKTKSLTEQFSELLLTNKRADGRKFEEARNINFQFGVISQARGSAFFELGKTKVIVSVFDPREISTKKEYITEAELHCEFKFAPFSCVKRRLHQQDSEEKHYSILLKQTLESIVCRQELPNVQIDIYALVLNNDGSCLSAVITAACLALTNAGIPLYDLLTSATVGIQGDRIFFDPTGEEEALCISPVTEDDDHEHGIVSMSVTQNQKQIAQLYHKGNISIERLNSVMEVMEKVCKTYAVDVQKSLTVEVVNAIKSGELK